MMMYDVVAMKQCFASLARACLIARRLLSVGSLAPPLARSSARLIFTV